MVWIDCGAGIVAGADVVAAQNGRGILVRPLDIGGVASICGIGNCRSGVSPEGAAPQYGVVIEQGSGVAGSRELWHLSVALPSHESDGAVIARCLGGSRSKSARARAGGAGHVGLGGAKLLSD